MVKEIERRFGFTKILGREDFRENGLCFIMIDDINDTYQI